MSDPDIVVLGKALGGGIPIGAYGVTPALAATLTERDGESFEAWRERVAAGGTMYGNALQIAAARATLEHVLTPEGHQRVNALGERLALGIESIITRLGLPWCAPMVCGGRASALRKVMTLTILCCRLHRATHTYQRISIPIRSFVSSSVFCFLVSCFKARHGVRAHTHADDSDCTCNSGPHPV